VDVNQVPEIHESRDRIGADAGTDDHLALAASRGDESAFVVLIERNYDRIYRLAWGWCGDRTEAEDVAQEVCVKLGPAIRSWRGEASFATWVYRIVFTTATDRLRRRRRVRPVEPSVMASLVEATAGPAGEPTGEVIVLHGQLWDEVRRLPDQQRDAVLLVYGEDLSHAEAAAVMGCSEKTVSWHLHAARGRLRSRFEVGQ